MRYPNVYHCMKLYDLFSLQTGVENFDSLFVTNVFFSFILVSIFVFVTLLTNKCLQSKSY